MAEAQICQITGLDPETARQYLQMANGDVARAIDLYFSGADVRKPAAQRAGPQHGSGPRSGSKAPPKKDAASIVDNIFNNAQKPQGGNPDEDEEGVDKHKITFYKNGFIVDDGEFRPNDDPANAEFLAAVEKGQVPRELMNGRQAVDVEVDDQREKDFKAPPKPFNPFQGKGYSIGDGTARPAPAAMPAAAPAGNQSKSFASGGEPTTKLRVLLPDRSVLTLTVNLSATIGDVKNYISQLSPQHRPSTLKLRVAVPPRELNDNSATVQSEGLKMAQIQVL